MRIFKFCFAFSQKKFFVGSSFALWLFFFSARSVHTLKVCRKTCTEWKKQARQTRKILNNKKKNFFSFSRFSFREQCQEISVVITWSNLQQRKKFHDLVTLTLFFFHFIIFSTSFTHSQTHANTWKRVLRGKIKFHSFLFLFLYQTDHCFVAVLTKKLVVGWREGNIEGHNVE